MTTIWTTDRPVAISVRAVAPQPDDVQRVEGGREQGDGLPDAHREAAEGQQGKPCGREADGSPRGAGHPLAEERRR